GVDEPHRRPRRLPGADGAERRLGTLGGLATSRADSPAADRRHDAGNVGPTARLEIEGHAASTESPLHDGLPALIDDRRAGRACWRPPHREAVQARRPAPGRARDNRRLIRRPTTGAGVYSSTEKTG